MPDPLEDLITRLRQDRALFLSGEEATCQGAVLPVLARLGWDRDNIREVVPQFAVGSGRVDYCLRIDDRSSVFIEVKRTTEELDKHQEQLLGYAFQDGVKIAVLTNGLLWWLYLPLREGSWDQRKFFAVDIQQQAPAVAAKHFMEFLGRGAVASGEAVRRAEEIHAGREKARRIKETLPKAWQQVCERPDELLVELLAEKVEGLCGYRPDQEEVAEYLANVLNPEPIPEDNPPRREANRVTRRRQAEPGGYTFRRAAAYSFLSQRHEVRTFKEILLGVCRTLHEVHRADFEKVLTLVGRQRSYFSRDYRKMTAPQEIPGTGIYAETNFSANNMMERCHDVLALFGYSADQLGVEVEDR